MSDCKKRSYETNEAAVFFAQAVGQRAYKCNTCGKYHTTSDIGNSKTKRRKVYRRQKSELNKMIKQANAIVNESNGAIDKNYDE